MSVYASVVSTLERKKHIDPIEKALKGRLCRPFGKAKAIQGSAKAITEREKAKAYPQFFPKGSIITKNRPMGRAAPACTQYLDKLLY